MSGRQDSNLRPPGPKPGALPACATSRFIHQSLGVGGLYFRFSPIEALAKMGQYSLDFSEYESTFAEASVDKCGEGGIRTRGTV